MNTNLVECALCHKHGVVVTERIANTDTLVIHCMVCGYVWNAVEPAHGVEQRASRADRRKASRTDRRKRDKNPK